MMSLKIHYSSIYIGNANAFMATLWLTDVIQSQSNMSSNNAEEIPLCLFRFQSPLRAIFFAASLLLFERIVRTSAAPDTFHLECNVEVTPTTESLREVLY